MAKIKWGMFVTDGRGKVGGHVLSKNRGGSYVRTKVTPANPQTSAQSIVRTTLASLSAAWSSLTANAIQSWQNATDDWKRTNEFGDVVTLSGKALFQSLNQNLILVGQAMITTPPAKIDMPTDTLDSCVVDISSTTITPATLSTSADYFVVVEATGAVTNGTHNVSNKYRRIYTVDAPSFDPADAYNFYVQKFGAPVAGQKVYVRIKYIGTNGQASVPQSVQAIVQA